MKKYLFSSIIILTLSIIAILPTKGYARWVLYDDFNYEDGMYLFAEDWDGSFGIKFDTREEYANFDYENPTPELVPEHLEIIVIGIY